MNTFHKDLQTGKKGETAAAAALAERGWRTTDLSDSPQYQKQDIDFRAEKNNITLTVEVKTDSVISRTGNMFIETRQNEKDGYPAKAGLGWYHYCKADIIFYIDSTNKRMYCFYLNSLRKYIDTHSCPTAAHYDSYKQVVGILVNINSFFSWLEEQKSYNQIIEVSKWL